MKKCGKCKIEKSPKEFHKNRSNPDGLETRCKECRRLDRINNIEKYKARDRIRDHRRKDAKKAYRNDNKETSRQYQREYYINNKEYIDNRNKNWRDNNKDKSLQYVRERCKEINFRLAKNIRTRFNLALKNNRKESSAIRDCGLDSLEDLKKHLESKFYPNPKTGEVMTWENYSKFGWHIDHIISLSSFDLEDEQQQRLAVHYTNLQPMWWFENISKSNK